MTARCHLGRDALDAQRPDALAMIYEGPTGEVRRYIFGQLTRLSNQLANAFSYLGVGRGDRVGILLGQRPQTALSHVTLYRMGVIAVPLFIQFGLDALAGRLGDSAVKVLVTECANVAKVSEIRDRLPRWSRSW